MKMGSDCWVVTGQEACSPEAPSLHQLGINILCGQFSSRLKIPIFQPLNPEAYIKPELNPEHGRSAKPKTLNPIREPKH